MSKRKIKIIKIKFTKKEQEEIDLINKGQTVPTVRTVTNKKNGVKQDIITNRRFTYAMARKRLFQLHGGICRCGAYPNYKVLYDRGDTNQGAWLVERYCQQCFDKWQQRIK